MIRNVDSLKKLICRQFGLSTDCCVSAKFRLVMCLSDYASFKAGNIEILWIGSFNDCDGTKMFACYSWSDEAVLVPNDVFTPIRDAQRIRRFACGNNQEGWICLETSQNEDEIIPNWHFDCRLVKQKILSKQKCVYGKWQRAEADGKTFMVWGFYLHGVNTPVKFFNIENGRCFDPDEVKVLGNINNKRGYDMASGRLVCHALRIDFASKREYLNY